MITVLPPPSADAGHGVLVRHRPREPQRIVDRRLVVRVGPHPHAAAGRAERGGVDGDQAVQPGRPVMEGVQRLVVLEGGRREDRS